MSSPAEAAGPGAGTAETPALLEVDAVRKVFGGLAAVDDVSFDVGEGEIVSMIGPNGAGKTTAFNCITGLYPMTSGTVRFDGIAINGLPPHRITRLGIARTFQNIRLFSYMTVIENVMVGEHVRMRAKVWDAVFHTPRAREEERQVTERAHDCSAVSGSPSTPTATRATFPTACRSGWRSPGPWPAGLACCSSTSPPPDSTRRRRWTSWRSSPACAPGG